MILDFIMRTFVVLTFVLISFGCSQLPIVQQWQASSFKHKQVNHVLVLGLSPSKVSREIFEQTVVDELNQANIVAYKSYPIFNDPLPSRNAIKKWIDQNQCHYVLVSQIGGEEVSERHKAENDPKVAMTVAEETNLYPDLYHFIHSFPNQFNTVEVGALMVNNKLFDSKTGKLVWQTTYKVSEKDSLSEAADKIGKMISQQLD